MLPANASLELQERYFLETLIWRRLDRQTPYLTYVQYPVFSLTPVEVFLLDYLHRLGLRFSLRPRTDPSSFIHLQVTMGRLKQTVRMEVYQGILVTCVFITERNSFAEEIKGWLDRHLGSEHFAANHYVATRHFIHYPYVLPVGDDEVDIVLQDPSALFPDIRHSELFFNFTAKEHHFLDKLETEVCACAEASQDPVYVQVYPRQSHTGSLELVINNSTLRQPARVFISGYHPVAYQIVTENTPLGFDFLKCLEQSLGAENFDQDSSRLKGKYLSIIFNVRYSLNLLDSLEDE